MDLLESAVLDLVRVGVSGDPASVRQVARRLARKLVNHPDPSFRTSLLTLILNGHDAAHLVRGTSPAPVDASSYLRLVREEIATDAVRPVFQEEEAAAVDAIVAERLAQEELMRSGLEPTKSVLLTGPPGVGKTMTARYLAAFLCMPLLAVDLAGVVSSYLGRTGQNLRQVLDYARGFPCVLLLDEFDALAKQRDDPADVGELKRIVNVLLLELENWPPHCLLVASTNHPELLDRAVWRRFDRVIEMRLPDFQCRKAIVDQALTELCVPASDAVVTMFAAAADGESGSDLVRDVRHAVRQAVLGGKAEADPEFTRAALRLLTRPNGDRAEAQARFVLLAKERRISNRAIGRMLGVSHVTVGAWNAATRSN